MLIKWINKNLLTVSIKCWYHILNKNEHIRKKIIDETSHIFPKDYDKINARIYFILFNCDVTCPICGNVKNFINFQKGFGSACSVSCSKKLTLDKFKETCIERYGVDNPMKLKKIKEKAKNTCIERYGFDNHMKNNTIKDKIKETCLERYGVKHPLQNKKIFSKFKETCLKKYGVDNPMKTSIVKDKFKETCLERYGVDNVNKLDETKNKIKETCLERYGEDFYKDNRKKSSITNKSKTYDNFKENLNKKSLIILSTKDEFIHKDIFRFKCLICNKEFESSGTNYQDVTCECKKQMSYVENSLINWLKSLRINVTHSNRSLIAPLELDVYLPDYDLAIEFDGLYWHSELYKDKNYHLNKTLLCKEKNIELIHIFENEWYNKKDIVKSIILNKIGMFDERIYARKCTIKELDVKTYKEFVELNHLQGYVPSKYKIGLYFEDELVQICSFGKNRFKKNETELIRSCSKIGYCVVGGFDKLVQHFIKTYKPEKLVSYVDRRYFNGNGYKKWKLVYETSPNYFYWKKGHDHIESRMKYQKHKLKTILEKYNEDMTENENMINNGYLRIYDCGNLKYEMRL